jgi:cation:H+ antiporter
LFEQFGLSGNIIILIASLIILDRASDLTIINSVKVADITGYGKTTIGFILIAFFTSLSALSVSVFSALGQQTVDVAIGNALGSNIANVCFILGACLLLASLKKVDYLRILPSMAKEDVGSLHFGLFVASIIPLALIYIGYASRFIGIVLAAIFAVYVLRLSMKKGVTVEAWLSEERHRFHRYLLLTFLGAAGVIVSSFLIVDSASFLASGIGVSAVVIGATVVAFGTSLPVLMVSIDAVRKGHLDLALGNIVGTCFINTTLILGIPLMALPLRVDVLAHFSNLVVFSVITSLLLWYFLSSEKISWREGAVLLFMYFLFLTISFSGYRV